MLGKDSVDFYKSIFKSHSFSQLGEDMVINNHLGWLGLNTQKSGSYIDIGAFHPVKISNTFKFYQSGSSGFAIDIGVEKESLWRRFRPRDTFLNRALVPNSYNGDTVRFSMSGSYGECTDHVLGSGIIEGQSGIEIDADVIKPAELQELVLESIVWKNAAWKFINIDIEGLDYEVASGLDLERLAPDLVAIEEFKPKHVLISEKISWYLDESQTVKMLRDRGYSLMSIVGPTLIFIANRNSQ